MSEEFRLKIISDSQFSQLARSNHSHAAFQHCRRLVPAMLERLASCYCFTSKRLADDQLPGVPELELARTRHHILVVGSVVVKFETVVFWLIIGELKVSESSI